MAKQARSDQNTQGAKRYTRREVLKAGAAAGAILAAPSILASRTVQAATGAPVKVGAIGSLTGVVSVWGRVLKMGAQLAIEEINASGGILGRPVELVMEDDESKADVGSRKARKLALEDNVDVIVGINHSGVLLAVAELLPELKKVLIGTCATSAEATTQRFNKYLFRIHTNSDQEGISGALYARELPYKRWSVIAPNYAYGYETWGSFISNLKRLRPDIEILDVQAWPKFATPDYTSHIARLQAARPDAVLSAMWGGDAVNLIRQMNRFGFLEKVAFFTPAALALDVFYALGEELPEGLHTPAHAYWFEQPQPERAAANRAFVEKFKQHFGEYPHSTAHGTYATVHAYRRAAEAAGSVKPDEVIAALEGMRLETPAFSGHIRREDHQFVQDIGWGRTTAANDLPFKRRVAQFQWTKGEDATPPVDYVLNLRKAGGKAEYYKYVVGA